MIRLKKRQDFEKHRHITDLNVIDLLIFKETQEYQETMNCWKQEVSAAELFWRSTWMAEVQESGGGGSWSVLGGRKLGNTWWWGTCRWE